MTAVQSWDGASFIVLGDSILDQGAGALDTVRDRLGFRAYVNAAMSGQSMTEDDGDDRESTATSALSHAYGEHALAYIAVGTNDFHRDLPLGALGGRADTDLDRSTFLGAYRTAIEHILAENPAIRLVVATPLQRDRDGYDTEHVNGAGHSLNDYAQGIRDLGRMYALPVCDLYADSGFTALTLPLFTDDGLHPNETGYVRLGNRITAFLRTVGA